MTNHRKGHEERNSGRPKPPAYRAPVMPDANAGRPNTPTYRKPSESNKKD